MDFEKLDNRQLAAEMKKALKGYASGRITDKDNLREGVIRICQVLHSDTSEESLDTKTDLILSLGFWAKWSHEDLENVRNCLEALLESHDRQVRAASCSAFGFLFSREAPDVDYIAWAAFDSALKGDGFEKTSALFGLHNAITNEEVFLPERILKDVIGLVFSGEQDIREDASSFLAGYSSRDKEILPRYQKRFKGAISTEISSLVMENLLKIVDNLG